MEQATGLAREDRGLAAGTSSRDGIEGSALERRAETSATAQAERAKAGVLARFQVAYAKPRDMDVARQVLLKECKRPGFADVALYAKPVGGQKIVGLSVRFAEAAARSMGNIEITTPTTYEDDEKRIVTVSATDLETNYTISSDVMVAKTIERKKLKQGQTPIATRENSYGDMVYIVPATEDEIVQKVAASVAKVRRNLILQLLPGDIQDECRRQIFLTQDQRDRADPDAARKKLVDAFFEQGVSAAELKEYVGHELGSCSPAELMSLRGVYASIRDGETTWREVMSTRGSEGEKQAPAARSSKVRQAAAQAAAKARGEEPSKIDEVGEVIDASAGEVAPEDEPPAS
jgi:hypothetical protein